MPQDIKARPGDADADENAPGFKHENLEGCVPSLATDADVRAAMEKAFDYRGDVTLTRRDGSRIDGYVFDRTADGPALDQCFVRLMPRSGGRVAVAYADIARIEFTGRDTAAGKSWETWVKKYAERKAAGETNIGLQPESLD